MQQLSTDGVHVATVDLVIIAVYLGLILVAGVLLTRRASQDIDSYFLGGRRIPWWLLGLSGTSSYFDVAGVMWAIAFFYIMGQSFIWPQWMWGGMMMLVVFGVFMGKWLRRSRVMTGAEWMVVRFGSGPAGETARVAYAAMAVVVAVAFIGFAEYGVGQFLNTFIDYPPHVLAVTLMAATSVYTIAAGLFGVVVTDFIQFCLILLGSCVLIAMAISMSSYEAIAAEVPAQWFSFVPLWEWPRMEQWELTAGYKFFALATGVWVAKGFFLSAGGPQQLYDMQRFLAARSPREASKAGMLWAVAQTPMFMVAAAVAVIGIVRWGGDLANPERLYPVVIGTMLPVGVKGLVLAGLLSAFMSTFSSTVNAGAAYLAHDGYQKFLRPQATQQQLVRASRISSLALVVAGILVGMLASNINDIFEWIMMVLGAAILMPNVLRWFWWRLNGYGYAVGTVVGVVAAIAQAALFHDWPAHVTFAVLFVISVVTSVGASLATAPTDMQTLCDFYRRVRPAGFWGPVRAQCAGDAPPHKPDHTPLDALSVLVGTIGVQALWLTSTYAVTHQWRAFAVAAVVTLAAAIVLYFTWYRQLPDPDEDVQLETPAPAEEAVAVNA